MFTGLVEAIGTVAALKELDPSQSGGNGTSLTVSDCADLLSDAHVGDSISINGTCLTITDFDATSFKFGVAPETLRRTNLGSLREGSKVNLERAVRADTRMGGHFVQGHVDTVATIESIAPDGNAITLRLKPKQAPDGSNILRYVVEKGFITLDGASLTVTKVNDAEGWFEIMLIAYTQEKVVLAKKKPGDEVNVEIDLVGKLVEKSVVAYFENTATGSPAVLEKICNCRSRAYLWTFYNINPLFFDSHHLFADRNRQFYQICPTCNEDLKRRGDCSIRRALQDASSEPENRDAYRPGWCAPYLRPLGNPPPLPQHGEAYLEGGGEDSGSNTSVASTPRPQDNSLLAPTKAIEASNGETSTLETRPAASTPDRHVEGSGSTSADEVRTADKLDYLEFLDKEYRQYMRHTRRGSTNRRDDDLQTGIFTSKPKYVPFNRHFHSLSTADRRFHSPKSRIVIPANSIPLGRILNFAFFTLALLVILYCNLPPFSTASTQSYDWARIRYRSPNPTPQAHGRCPGLEKTTKPVLIIARISSDTPVLETPANRAHEALPYLTFIIDNYANLPEHFGMVFIHGSRFAWHNDHPDYDNLVLLQSLNISSALADTGYANLKCDWAASTCVKDGVESQAGWSNRVRRVIEPWNTKIISDAEMAGSMMQPLQKLKTKLSGSDILRSQCCAQFVVSRKNIVQHTRDEYIALSQWLLDGTQIPPPHSSSGTEFHAAAKAAKAAAHPDDRVAGRVMSYLWHILFLPRDQVSIVEETGPKKRNG
ncbi:hypothetical protein DV737_g3158, partial [Chaetothyriales sp. CBS 132003]